MYPTDYKVPVDLDNTEHTVMFTDWKMSSPSSMDTWVWDKMLLLNAGNTLDQ